MKYTIITCIAVFFISCGRTNVVTIENPSNEVEGPVIAMLRKDSFKSTKEGKLPQFILDEGLVTSQFLDADNDGSWDEALLWIDFKGQDQARVSVEWVVGELYPSFEKKTNVFLGYSEKRDGNYQAVLDHLQPSDHKPQDYPLRYQSEGPIWESELVAYRSYFDARNGKDIFGKVEPSIRAEKIGYDEDYHKLQDWGMDVLKVGNSLGAGAIAMMKNDSVYRLGVTTSSKFQLLENGPLMSRFKLSYKGWSVGDSTYDLEETISIFAGQKWYKSEVSIVGSNAADTLVTGIVTLKDPQVKGFKASQFAVVYTHGIQSENKDGLGMAIIVPQENFMGSEDAPLEGKGVVSTKLVYLRSVEGFYTYYFTCDWEGQNTSFQNINVFETSIRNQLETISRL